MYYLDSASMDPAWNLALEQFVFDQLGPREDCFMLWQNDRTIVVGKYQNVLEEINSTYVKEHGITVVRRLSGGGAVYHDRGNLNFTFVARDCQGGMIDFSSFCRPVVDALREMGVPAQINGRNDMTISAAGTGYASRYPDVRLRSGGGGPGTGRSAGQNSVQGTEIGAQPGHQYQALCK